MNVKDVTELNATFLTAAATKDKNTVFAVFVDTLRRRFVIEWNRCDDDNFDISLNVMSESSELNNRISTAISAGESNDNEDLTLYLAIRDKFDRQDCKALCSVCNEK